MNELWPLAKVFHEKGVSSLIVIYPVPFSIFYFFVDEIWIAYFGKDTRSRSGYYEQFLIDAIRDVNVGFFDHPVRTPFPGKWKSAFT